MTLHFPVEFWSNAGAASLSPERDDPGRESPRVDARAQDEMELIYLFVW